MLVRGQATTVDVPYIDKPFCGVAMIDHRYVRLNEIAKAKDEEPATCVSDIHCTRTSRYYLDEDRLTEPFIIIFQGPKHPPA